MLLKLKSAKPLTDAVKKLLAHVRKCQYCQLGTYCDKGMVCWDVLRLEHWSRIHECIDYHIRRYPGPKGVQELSDKLMRVARVLEPR